MYRTADQVPAAPGSMESCQVPTMIVDDGLGREVAHYYGVSFGSELTAGFEHEESRKSNRVSIWMGRNEVGHKPHAIKSPNVELSKCSDINVQR